MRKKVIALDFFFLANRPMLCNNSGEGDGHVPELVTLENFEAEQRHYHIYRINSTALDHLAHYHDYYQVCYVVSGEILHRQGKDAVALQAGDAFIVPPGFVHSLHFNNAYSEMYSLSFSQSLFAPGFPQSNAYQFLAGLQTGTSATESEFVRLRVPLERASRQSMEELMKCLIRQQETDCPQGLSAAPSLVASILYLLSQSYYQHAENVRGYDTLADYSGTLLQCIRYVEQHYKEPLSPTELAKQFGLSRSVFFSAFPQFSGMPFRKYVAHKRIIEAQMLMRAHPKQTISQIAAAVGYEDDSTFYRNFLRITGVSPLQYKTGFRHRNGLSKK